MKTPFLLTSTAVLGVATAVAAPIEYFDSTAFAAAAGPLTTNGFDNFANGTLLTGNEFPEFTLAGRRIGVMNPQSFGMTALNVNSPPQGICASLFYDSLGSPVFDNLDDNFDFTLHTLTTAVGLWIGNLGAGEGDLNPTQVTFYDAQGGVLAEESLNQAHAGVISSGLNNRIFYGVVSDTFISRVAVRNGAGDFDAIILDDFQFAPHQNTCVPGSVFVNVSLPEMFIPLDDVDKKCPAQIRFAPLGLNFTVQSTTEPGALCEAKSDPGTLAILLVCPDGRETIAGYGTTEATLTLFQDGTLRWYSPGFKIVTPDFDMSPPQCDFAAITDSINIITGLGLDPSTTPFETIVRTAEPIFHDRLGVMVEESACLQNLWDKKLKKILRSYCGCHKPEEDLGEDEEESGFDYSE